MPTFTVSIRNEHTGGSLGRRRVAARTPVTALDKAMAVGGWTRTEIQRATVVGKTATVRTKTGLIGMIYAIEED